MAKFVYLYPHLARTRRARLEPSMAKSNIQETIVPVLEMSCAVCAANVENTTRALPGVLQADVNFASNDMHLVYDRSVISLEEIQRQIRAIGY